MQYRCESCGFQTAKWMGFCPQCGASGLAEVAVGADVAAGPVRPVAEAAAHPSERRPSGITEVDRVLGGGFVPGSVVLLGGEPGVGKSTLLLQVAESLGRQGASVLVATAEESAEQVGLRARRLGVRSPRVAVLAESSLDVVLATVESMEPDLLVVDSVQAISTASGIAGSVTQVREAAARLIDVAKRNGMTVVLVGHVTKDGSIAGPKLLEHMVDVVVYLEGESEMGLRAVRTLKNRFGATHRVGLFEMGNDGLREVADPSSLFVADWQGSTAGTVVFPAMEGRRPLLVEIQALVHPTQAPQPRRSVRGLEAARVQQIVAVLERHARVPFSNRDVYVSVVGGYRIVEPAAGLAVAVALVSSHFDVPVGSTAVWGEVGLTGEVRPVSQDRRRREEVARLGIRRVVAPNGAVLTIGDALDRVFGD